MNILFEDWDGSQMPRSKLKNSAGIVAERYAGPTAAQDRLIGEMDRGMAQIVEQRLNELLERSNRREANAGRPISSLARNASEMASENKDFDGYLQCIPIAAEGLKDSTVGSLMGLPQAPFVSVSLVHDSAPDANISVSSPTDLAGHVRPRWRQKDSDSKKGYCSQLCLPLYTKLRPIQRLRIEVQAMDRAFGHTLLGATELSFVAQPSTATFLRLPLTLPSSSYSISYLDSVGLQGLGSEACGFIDIEIQVIAESGTRAGNAGQVTSDFLSPLIWECLTSEGIPNQPPVEWQNETGSGAASSISDFLILEPKGGAWVTSIGLPATCSTIRNKHNRRQSGGASSPKKDKSFTSFAGEAATSVRDSMAAAYVVVAGQSSGRSETNDNRNSNTSGHDDGGGGDGENVNVFGGSGVGGSGGEGGEEGKGDASDSDEFSFPPPSNQVRNGGGGSDQFSSVSQVMQDLD